MSLKSCKDTFIFNIVFLRSTLSISFLVAALDNLRDRVERN